MSIYPKKGAIIDESAGNGSNTPIHGAYFLDSSPDSPNEKVEPPEVLRLQQFVSIPRQQTVWGHLTLIKSGKTLSLIEAEMSEEIHKRINTIVVASSVQNFKGFLPISNQKVSISFNHNLYLLNLTGRKTPIYAKRSESRKKKM